MDRPFMPNFADMKPMNIADYVHHYVANLGVLSFVRIKNKPEILLDMEQDHHFYFEVPPEAFEGDWHKFIEVYIVPCIKSLFNMPLNALPLGAIFMMELKLDPKDAKNNDIPCLASALYQCKYGPCSDENNIDPDLIEFTEIYGGMQ